MNSINGFNNTGAICYFNSLIQSLLSLKSFVKFVEENKEKNQLCKMISNFINGQVKDPFFTSILLRELVIELVKNKKNPNDYFGQQSASEFMVFLIDKLGADKVFEIKYLDEITCSECKNVTKKIDLGIFHNVYFVNSENEKTNILDEMSYKKENLNYYNCEKCNKKTDATKERFLVKIPDVITFVFMNKYTNNFVDISYMQNFRIQEEKNNDPFVLKATIEHMGTLNNGHYFSRVFRNGQYYIANDKSINSVNSLEKLNTTYMLFYEK